METFAALLTICAGNSPVPGDFPAQRPVTRSFDVFFDLRLNKRLTTQSSGWWFETLSRSLWRHRNDRSFSDPTLAVIWHIFVDTLVDNTRVDISRSRQKAAIFQNTFSNAVSWMKIYEFQLKFRWKWLLWVQLTIFQHWFRWWLGAGQATSHYLSPWWWVYWRIYVSLGGLNE